MSLSGQQTILIGLPNESTGSDSLYTAFTKINDNFDTVFSNASPYNIFSAGNGIGVTSNNVTGTVTITNTGITSIIAGTDIAVTNNNGAVTITNTGGGGNGGGGTVTSIAMTGGTGISISPATPITSSGTFLVTLANAGVTAGTYNNPVVSVDVYGRVTSVANGNSVTSVGLSPGTGIQITGGPITSSGNITVTNTGVTRILAGSGILVNGGNGNVTISATSSGGTVTSVGVNSNTLTIAGSPITSSGIITVNLPNSISLSNITVSGNATVGNLLGPVANGNSNINIPTANGNINLSAVGNANVLIVTGTGANINGTANITGNITGANIYANTGTIGANVVSANNQRWISSENLTNGAAANLSVIASYFTTAAAETATLAAGTNGQIKTFMMLADSGDMVITVTNPGWGGAGTMTFSAVGQGCTLQYINSKWFCIGNNGVAFA